MGCYSVSGVSNCCINFSLFLNIFYKVNTPFCASLICNGLLSSTCYSNIFFKDIFLCNHYSVKT